MTRIENAEQPNRAVLRVLLVLGVVLLAADVWRRFYWRPRELLHPSNSGLMVGLGFVLIMLHVLAPGGRRKQVLLIAVWLCLAAVVAFWFL